MRSIGKQARFAGLLYLVLTLLGIFSLLYVPGKLIVHGNPAATAANIVGNETLLRLGVFSELVAIVVELSVALALYRLFERVDKVYASLLVILGGILPIPIYFINAINWIAALLLAQGGSFAAAFTAPQREALMALFIALHHYGFVGSELFAGLWLLPMGVLAYRSGFSPRFLGFWLVVAGVAYCVQFACGLLLPQYADTVSNVASPLGLGELVFMLWLVIMGARQPRVPLQVRSAI